MKNGVERRRIIRKDAALM